MGGHAAEVPGRVQEGFHLAPQAHGLLPQQLGHQQQQPGQGLPFQHQQMHHGQQHGLHRPQEQHGVLMHQQHQHLAQPHGLHQQMPPPMHFLQVGCCHSAAAACHTFCTDWAAATWLKQPGILSAHVCIIASQVLGLHLGS